jgi:CDP-glucose 4,6-dehydratase
MNFGDVYKNKTVLVTGHSGFKGSWLSEWLLLLGANVVGYSLVEPPSEPSHFTALQLGEHLTDDVRDDIRSLDALQAAIQRHKPDFIFHLAAQPLVWEGFNAPYYTVETNVMGSLNVLEAVRRENSNCIVIMITTDKVYENIEWLYAYRENDPLGGHDPYSASKACADIVISSYQRSFFGAPENCPADSCIAVASVRGGNVIGGGDWAMDRIVPDSIRSLAANRPIPVRNKNATRPWQHVLELLSGYLHLGAEISHAIAQKNQERLQVLCSAFNFGPHITSNKTVEQLVQEVLKHWSGEWEDFTEPGARHEAGRLNLTIDKAYHTLNWQPRWNFEETIKHTVDWYRQYYRAARPEPASLRELTRQQILLYADGLLYSTNG